MNRCDESLIILVLILIHKNLLIIYFINEKVKGRQIWGHQSYTGDSDIVCILQHSGLFTLKYNKPDFYALKAVLSVLPGQSQYEGTENNNLKSKSFVIILFLSIYFYIYLILFII